MLIRTRVTLCHSVSHFFQSRAIRPADVGRSYVFFPPGPNVLSFIGDLPRQSETAQNLNQAIISLSGPCYLAIGSRRLGPENTVRCCAF